MKTISDYINSKENSWSDSTKRSEKARLLKWARAIDGNPETLWKALSGLAPYTKNTVFIRVGSYYEWATKDSVYKDWMKLNAKLFKHNYVPKKLTISYDEAMAAVRSIPEESVRTRALDMLQGAVRWVESSQPKDQGMVKGKGGKIRPDFRPRGLVTALSYSTFIRKLKKYTGLTPHDLRKLALTKLAHSGASAADLCYVAGWSSIQTAYTYLQPLAVDKIKHLMAK